MNNAVQVTITLSEEVAAHIQNGTLTPLARRLLELAAIQAYEEGLITERELMDTLDFEDREELYEFFKANDVRATYYNLQKSSEDLAELLTRHNQ